MPSSIQQQVVGFDISVDVIQFVDRINGQYRLRDEESRLLFGKYIVFDQMGHHISS